MSTSGDLIKAITALGKAHVALKPVANATRTMTKLKGCSPTGTAARTAMVMDGYLVLRPSAELSTANWTQV